MNITKCYYCVCTGCNEHYCPFTNKCFMCHMKNKHQPRLDCDYFVPKRHKRYKFRRGHDEHCYAVFCGDLCIASHMTLSQANEYAKKGANLVVKHMNFIFPR